MPRTGPEPVRGENEAGLGPGVRPEACDPAGDRQPEEVQASGGIENDLLESKPLDQIAPRQGPVRLERLPDLAKCPLLGGKVDAELEQPPGRIFGEGLLE